MATTAGSGVPQFISDVTLDPSSIAAFSRQTETFTVAGLKTEWVPTVVAPSLESGVQLLGAWVSATNTLKLLFENVTSAAINPASQTFKVIAH